MGAEAMGYVDVHLHLVPGVDDGAVDRAQALAMARSLVEHGWSEGVVTPHIRPGLFDNDPVGVRRGVDALAALLAEEGVPFTVRPGAEHYLDPDLVAGAATGACVPLGGDGPFVLFDAPTAGPVPALPEIVFRLRRAGLVPVLAHPERCEATREPDTARRLVDGGALLQLDLGSVAGAYGPVPTRAARRLLAEGLYAVAGTDLHRPRQAERGLGSWLDALTRAAGAEARERLLGDHPRRILAGEIPPGFG